MGLPCRTNPPQPDLQQKYADPGGNNSPGIEADLLKIQSGTRANVHLSYKSSSALTESRTRRPPRAKLTSRSSKSTDT